MNDAVSVTSCALRQCCALAWPKITDTVNVSERMVASLRRCAAGWSVVARLRREQGC